MLLRRALAAAAALMLLCTGCGIQQYLPDNGSGDRSIAEHTDQRYQTDALKDMADAFVDAAKEPGAEAALQTQLDTMLDEVNKAYAVYIRAEMDYYADWNNTDLSALSDQTYGDYCVADEIVTWACCNAYHKSDYQALLSDYVQEDWLPYYLSNSLSRVISRARSNASSQGELLEDYYETAYSEDVDPENPDETNLACAELYLKTLDTYDLSEYLYDYYARDYDVEDASAMYQNIVEKLVPISRALDALVYDDPRYDILCESGYAVDDPYEVLSQYAPTLSDEIAESVNKLLSEKCYCVAKGTGAYDGSYTVALPGEHTALMYTYLAGDYYDLTTVVHEFGHFHSDWRDGTPIYIASNCIDLAEVQSQSMEMLFTSFYDDIYGDDADYLELLALSNILDSVISGFGVGEFEYQVMQRAAEDSITPQEICDLYREIADACNMNIEMYQISHLYEQPGYYISYGVSALAALQIYAEMQENFAHAVELYTKVSSISSVSGEYRIVSGLEHCGFDPIFSESSLDEIVNILNAHIEKISV